MINKISAINFNTNHYQANNKTCYTSNIPNNNIYKISFGSKPAETNNKLCQQILQKGYKLFREVNIIDPKGLTVKGYSFIKHTESSISSIITDKEFYELGQVSASNEYSNGEKVKAVLKCDVVNYTESWMPAGFSRVPEFPTRNSSEGKYRHVASEAYKALEDYTLKKLPEVVAINAYPLHQGSWDFFVKLGFDGSCGYDSWLLTNDISKIIRKK